jgi:predicted DNA-binding transcriptional regulator YafY
MRASRLLTILMTLQVRGQVTARALAAECEVTQRTIYRDIDALSAAGVPVYAERGPEGGYRLLDGYKTRVNGLTSQEAEALFLGGLPGPAAELGLGSVMAAAQLKLLTALPTELRRSAETLRARFHLDAPGWFNRADETPHLPQIAEAVWSQRPIEIGYRTWPAGMLRQIEPLGIVLKSGLWYVVAAARGRLRTYRVSRILSLTLVDGRFERPADFDLGEHWKASSSRYEEDLLRSQAVVRVSPRGLELMFAWTATEAAARAAGSPDAAGWREVVLPIESLDRATADMLRFGAEVEVLAPDALRERVADSIRAMIGLYR